MICAFPPITGPDKDQLRYEIMVQCREFENIDGM